METASEASGTCSRNAVPVDSVVELGWPVAFRKTLQLFQQVFGVCRSERMNSPAPANYRMWN